MELESSQKQGGGGGSDSSSEENEVKTSLASKRSYDCTYCKRGFTNAQALGGHMNMHRKDRIKAKEIITNPMYSEPISSEPSRYYYPVLEPQRNYLMSYQPSASNTNPSPSHPLAYNDRDFIVPQPQTLSMNQQILGANLSLGPDPTCVEDNEVRRRGNVEEAGLDLELRLGRIR